MSLLRALSHDLDYPIALRHVLLAVPAAVVLLAFLWAMVTLTLLVAS
jgi:hypothetical protein